MREGLIKIINYLTGSILLSSLHCTIAAVIIAADKQTFLHSLIYLPIVVILSAAAKKSKHFWQYLTGVVLAFVLVYLTSNPGIERGVTLLLTIIAALSFFIARSKKMTCWLSEPSYPYMGVFLGMYLLELRFSSELVKNYAIIGVGIYYLLCTYQTNISGMNNLMNADAQLERFPAKRLRQSNYLMLGIQTVVVTIGMCIAPFMGIDGLLYKLANIMRNLIAWLLRGLESDKTDWGTQEAAKQVELEAVQTTETSWFIEWLLKLWDILSWIIVIAITGYAIYRILKFLYQLYLDFDARSVENGDQIEKIYTVAVDGEKRMQKQRKQNLFWDRSPNARIRKYYKKRVLKDWKEPPKPSMTPEEIEKAVEMEAEEKKIFHEYYEKARYAKESCTKEELQRILTMK